MKTVLGFMAALIAAALLTVSVGLAVSYVLTFVNFSGPQSVVEPCFAIGFTCGLAGGVTVGFFIARHFWREYVASEPD
ncbi:MAG TPA: hypothetical protein VG267_19395 [Terracidiphilus sp.]|jgi:hypothetical protein|nr:hypothetical protein [Terracidiphilus sp.]